MGGQAAGGRWRRSGAWVMRNGDVLWIRRGTQWVVTSVGIWWCLLLFLINCGLEAAGCRRGHPSDITKEQFQPHLAKTGPRM